MPQLFDYLANLRPGSCKSRLHEPSGRPSKCQTYAERIKAKVHLGLTAHRIYQDLVVEVGFKGS